MLQLEDALNNLRGTATELVDLHVGVILLRDDSLLLREITHTLEDEVGAAARDLHVKLLTQRIHVAADLLEVLARHVDDAREVEVGDLDVLHIRVKELQEVVRDRGLLRVLHTNAELVGIGRGQIEREVVVVAHGLDELEQVDHVHTEDVLGGAEVGLKAIRVKAEIDEDRVGLIHGHHLDALGVKLQVGLRQNLLEGLNERAKGTGLDGLDLKQIAVGIDVWAG